ncbi:hypothetical protein AK812_SmicGene28877 [Symbiodinium microadriaticum]|uniref:Uncharacterized protein n=1 Tax=Symbiodinium microadriaticum TaxID=2951 RepID=A0A1Q9D380_SYMMI|nr:hypothetical protein AK812_SmicGene28877 [Symbiodinium microadriaticum]
MCESRQHFGECNVDPPLDMATCPIRDPGDQAGRRFQAWKEKEAEEPVVETICSPTAVAESTEKADVEEMIAEEEDKEKRELLEKKLRLQEGLAAPGDL